MLVMRIDSNILVMDYWWKNLETVEESNLLGPSVGNDLKWEMNTDNIIKNANKCS